MAYYDWIAEDQKNEKNLSAKKFIESLPLENDKGEINFNSLCAKQKFNELEELVKKQQEQIKEYQNFFNTLKSFLPKDFSVHDKLF